MYTDFEYDGIRLSGYGYMLCEFSSNGLQTVTNGAKIKFSTTPILRGGLWISSGTWYEASDGTGDRGNVAYKDPAYWKLDKTNEGAKYPYHLKSYDKNDVEVGSGWVEKLPEYHTGLRRASKDHLAITQDGGQEIVKPKDGGLFTLLDRGDMVLDSTATENFWNLYNDPSGFIKQYAPQYTPNFTPPSMPNVGVRNVSNNMQNTFEITVNGVNDIQSLIREVKYDLQHDRKFERMIQDISINTLAGGSTMEKYRYRW